MESKEITRNKLSVKAITYVGLMTALMCILGPMSIPIGPIPISLGNLAVFLAAVILGGRYGTISVGVYLLLGAVGLPIFAGYTGGIGKLFGPTGGYLLAFLLTPGIIASLYVIFQKKFYAVPIGMVLSNVVIYLLGSGWLAYQAGMTYGEAFAVGVIPFMILDLIKVIIACFVAIPVKKALDMSHLRL